MHMQQLFSIVHEIVVESLPVYVIYSDSKRKRVYASTVCGENRHGNIC